MNIANDILNLPDAVSTIIFVFALILMLSPYLEGKDFGIFKIPEWGSVGKKRLKIYGPVIIILVFILHANLINGRNPVDRNDDFSNEETDREDDLPDNNEPNLLKIESLLNGVLREKELGKRRDLRFELGGFISKDCVVFEKRDNVIFERGYVNEFLNDSHIYRDFDSIIILNYSTEKYCKLTVELN